MAMKYDLTSATGDSVQSCRDLGLAPGVQGVIHRRLELELVVVGGAVDKREAVRDRVQPGAFWRGAAVFGHVGGMHDLGEPDQGRVTGQPVVLDQHVE